MTGAEVYDDTNVSIRFRVGESLMEDLNKITNAHDIQSRTPWKKILCLLQTNQTEGNSTSSPEFSTVIRVTG